MKYKPMLAKLGDEKILYSDKYVFEPKLDGYRAICYINSEVRILSRRGINLSEKFSFDFNINAKSAVLDGEIIAYDEKGRIDFNLVQQGYASQFIVFDILERDGEDLRGLPLEKRKEILEEVLDETKSVKKITTTKEGSKLLKFVKEKELEGIIAKKNGSKYHETRSPLWIKIKFNKTIDCVVIGYNSKKRELASLSLGLYDDNKNLVDIGKVGTGFNESNMKEILGKLKSGETLVCEVKYLEMTKDNKLRAPVFVRLRDDKSPQECTFEQLENRLSEYESKRNFSKTPEPQNEKKTKGEKKIFVIQRHDARRLHYDFRLEDEGVLKSFAIPKGLSNNPSDKRLAVQTEDHPMSYANFEGEIPKGEYGGGDVKIWDKGHFVNITIKNGKVMPLSEAIDKGHFLIWTKGEKIEGGFAFTRTKDNEWIVVKMKDDEKKNYPDDIEVNGKTIEFTNTQKIVEGIEKGQLINYFKKVSRFMISHIRGRPLTLVRFPDGFSKTFFQKDASDYFPDWIETVKIQHSSGETNYVVASNEATIIYLANQVCEIHIWGSSMPKLEYPNRITFDLDPSKKDYELLREIAKSLRKFLELIGFKTYIMTTGGKGFHIVVPIKPELKFKEVRDFAKNIADVFARARKEEVTTEFLKNKREDKIFLDVNRNSKDQSAIAPYSVRAKPNFPIAKPFLWDEIDKITPISFDIYSEINEDVWEDFDKNRVSLKKVIERLKI